jgi:predicted aminopeptidase
MEREAEWRFLGMGREMISPMLLLAAVVVGNAYVLYTMHQHVLALEQRLPTDEARREQVRALLEQDREKLEAAMVTAAEAERLRAQCAELTP